MKRRCPQELAHSKIRTSQETNATNNTERLPPVYHRKTVEIPLKAFFKAQQANCAGIYQKN